MIERLLSNNTSNRYNLIMTPTRGENLLPLSQKWDYYSYRQENCNLYQVTLQNEQFTGAKGATPGVNINII